MRRDSANPILTRKEIPRLPPPLSDVTSVFNPGAARLREKIMLLLRVQNRARETFLHPAESADGRNFRVRPEPVRFRGLEAVRERVYHCYDPRITRLEDTFYILFAMDMEQGCRLGLARTEDFEQYEFMGIVSEGDARNGVLFPEKVGGRYVRLERPNTCSDTGGAASGDTIVLSASDDLLHWEPVAPVMRGRFHYWDELIGPGPPPVKTREGWLLVYHGVALHLACAHVYQAGVVLLDLEDPSKVLARGRYNVLEPREAYELCGQVPNVVFPSGLVAERTDTEGYVPGEARLLLYYGAADTCTALAWTTAGELIAAARAGPGAGPAVGRIPET